MWIDHSTTDHEQNKVFAAALEEVGGELLEAPITGGLEALKKGQMAVWVAGNKVGERGISNDGFILPHLLRIFSHTFINRPGVAGAVLQTPP